MALRRLPRETALGPCPLRHMPFAPVERTFGRGNPTGGNLTQR